jgi:low affinity Fe/Cu permease
MSKISDFNEKLAAKITSGVATMWCAYIFAIIALISLPSALKSGDLITIVSWIAQTFLQLVLLSIIMVGQNVASAGVEQKIDETHTASLGEFELAKEARELNREEIAELKKIASEIHQLLKNHDSFKK